MSQSSLWSTYQRRRRRRKKTVKRTSQRRSQLMFEAFEPRIVLATSVIDINPSGPSLVTPPDRVSYMPIGDLTYFVANDGSSGQELWITDGTETGTRRVKDINPGPSSSYPGVFQEFNGELYFVADDGVNGEELWKSDGTEAGTILLSDINPGSGYQYPYGEGPLQSFPRDFTEHNGVLLFSAEDAVNGAELWRTDGTADGTVLLADIFPGTFDDFGETYPNSSNPTGLVEFNGEVYFAADDGTSGRELWKTDGTAAGTVLVKDIYTGDYNYVRNGTDYGVYPNSSSPAQMTVVGDTLFFIARDSLQLGATPAEDQSNYELWKTDGTDAGTVKVREINPGDDGSLRPDSELFNLNGLLVFAADDGISGEELWRSDGTEDGTILVKDFTQGAAGNLSNYAYFEVHNGELYFAANDGVSGVELWRSNGTFTGTQLVKDINPGSADGVPLFMESVNGLLYFTAVDDASGVELWRSDGTDEGTFLLEDLLPGSDESAAPSDFSSAGEALIFAADDGTGRELWVRTEDAQTANAALTVFVNSEEVAIPANIGVETTGETTEVYTNASGALEFSTDDIVTLGDFFDTWRVDAGQVPNNPSATFSSTELLGNAVDADHSVQMFVNGELVTEYEDYSLRPDDSVILVYGDNPVVSLVTNFGPILIELFEGDTPITVDNFLDYVNDGSYVNAIFHRSVTDFVIQGGGFRTTSPTLVDLSQITEIPANDPIQNEPGIPNTRATIAMAKLGGDPNSATNQFFVSLDDNRSILDNQNGGFTVFGQVLDMTTADAIAALPIVDADGGGVFGELPVTADDVLPTIVALEGNGEIMGRQYDDLNANGSYDAGEEVVGAVVYVDANSNGLLDVGETQTTTDVEGRYLLLAEPGTQSVRSGDRLQTVDVELGRSLEDVDFVDIMLDAPTSIDLLAVSDLGPSDTDDLTRLNNSGATEILQFTVTGVSDGADVRLYSDGIQVGSGLAFGSTVTVATDGMTTIENGVHSFTAKVVAGSQESDASPTLSVEILANDLAFTTDPPNQAQVGQTLSFDVGSDDEGNNGLAYSLSAAPNGMVIDASTGVITWTPTASQAVPVTFDIVASDKAGNTITQIADMTVLGDIPALPDSYEVDENMPLTVDVSQGVLANDGSGAVTLTASVVDQPANGTVTLDTDGSFTYTPNLNFSGQDSFTYTAASDTGTSNVARATITVNPVNGDSVISGYVFIDSNNDGVHEEGVETGIPGSLLTLSGTDNAGNSVKDTFLTNDMGFYSFEGLSSGTYAIHQSQPEATVDGIESTEMDDAVIGENVISNIVVVSDSTSTEIENNNFGERTLHAKFMSIAWFFASVGSTNPDAQTLRNVVAVAEEQAGNQELAASIREGSTDGPANTPPVASTDSYTAIENRTLTIDAADGVLADDSDDNNDALTAELADTTMNGTLTFETDGSFTYTPDTDFTGTDFFTYTASDGVDSSNQVEVTITVETNTAPVAAADNYAVAQNVALTIDAAAGVLANDSDANDDALTAALVETTTNGVLTFDTDGSFTYEPNVDFSGTDSFTYTASDGDDSSNQVEVTITVDANTAPVTTTDNYTVAENGSLTINAADGVLANDSDANGDALTAVLVDTTTNGVLTFESDGSFTYTPDANYTGIDSFTYTASDGVDSSNEALVTFIVDADVLDNTFTISENTPSGTEIGSVTPSAALGSDRIYEIVNNSAAPEIALNPDDHLSGDADVQLVLIEYLDLQCPICAQFHPIVESLKDDFDDELLVVSRHLPLESIHPNARSAARSAEAAGRQGAFDEMIDLMFTNQSDWAGASDPQPFFDGYADDLGLDLVQFAADRVDPDIDDRIQRDINDAQSLSNRGVTSGLATPTFFLEGRFINNNDAFDDFEEIIEDELDDFDAPFVVDRLSGEIIAAPGVSFNASSTPVRTFDVRVTDSNGASTTETVTVNVINPQAALSSAAAVDAAFAEFE